MPTFRHGKNTNVLINEFDVSNYFRSSSFQTNADVNEATVYTDTSKSYVVGNIEGKMSLDGLFSFSDADAEIEDILSNRATVPGILGQESGQVVTIAPEGYSFGSKAQCMVALENSYQISNSVADIVSINAEFMCKSSFGSGVFLNPTGNVWAWDDTTTGAANDAGVSSTFGGLGVLHVLTNTLNANLTVEIEDGDAVPTWGTLGTFATVTAAQGAVDSFLVTGQVLQNLRFKMTTTATSGQITFAVAFCRFNS